MKEVKKLSVLFVVSILLFSLAPVVAQDETSPDSSTTSQDTSSSDSVISQQDSSTETQTSDGDDSTQTKSTTTEEPATDSTEIAESTIESQVAPLEEARQEYQDEVIVDGGITPGDAFYAFDKFFDSFGDPIEVREERIGEVKSLIESGNFDGAKEALEDYKKQTEKLERESDPEKRVEARRSAAAIYGALRDVEDKIPEEQREVLYEEIIERESGVITSVEISSKIKELCIQLAELDPMQYRETCRGENDAPKWKKNLDRQLTDEQKDEAKKFGQIMSQCMKTSGRECKCDEISFYDFSVTCSQIAPLAVKCDEGDEESCKMMDEVEMPELPDYLQDVFDNAESQFGEAKYGMHMPQECVDAGIDNPNDCRMFMIKEKAPPECRQALLDADVKNEKESKEICNKIMFEQYAPQECIDKGITNPEDCGSFMESQGMTKQTRQFSSGPAPGKQCMQIQDATERLKCFENSFGQMQESYGVGERFEQGRGEITWQCKENRIHDSNDCKVFMEEEWPQQEQQRKQEYKQEWQQRDDWRTMEQSCASSCLNNQFTFINGRCICGKPGQYLDNQQGAYEESECKDGCSQECPGASRTNCVDGGRRCECSYEEKNEYQSSEGEYQPGPGPGTTPGEESFAGEPGNYQPPSQEQAPQEQPQTPASSESSSSSEGSSSGGSSESSSGGGESSGGESSPSEGESAPATGAVIGNKFLNYYY